jgi:hypothetical protein
MDGRGEKVTQITFENPRRWEHVAVSCNRRCLLANNSDGGELWVFDLEEGTEAQLVPHFEGAGGGGVAWDPDGCAYFAAREAGARTTDAYKIRYDGTGLKRLTDTSDACEADVSVSQDGSLITYAKMIPSEQTCGVWVANSDGSNQRMVYKGGTVGTHSAHDPEISTDNAQVAFSVVNLDFKNFPEYANTAHDIWKINMDGTGLTCLTQPGPISIIPNWQGDMIAYMELNEKDNYRGASVVNADGTGQRKIRAGAMCPKWIPLASE